MLARPHVIGDVDAIIQRLLKELPDGRELWRELHSKFKIDLFLGIWLRDWNRGFSLTPETLTILADRKLEVGFDIYCDVTQPELDFQIKQRLTTHCGRTCVPTPHNPARRNKAIDWRSETWLKTPIHASIHSCSIAWFSA